MDFRKLDLFSEEFDWEILTHPPNSADLAASRPFICSEVYTTILVNYGSQQENRFEKS